MTRIKRDSQKFGISDKRGREPTRNDPYIPEEGRKEVALCESCLAVYQNKRWYLDAETFESTRKAGNYYSITCPACQKIAQKYPEGIVTLKGDYFWNHEDEIRNIIRNEEEKARQKNPLERIMRMDQEDDCLIVETTEEKLAEHLGRALHKAHQGNLKVSWTSDHAICRVTWERSA